MAFLPIAAAGVQAVSTIAGGVASQNASSYQAAVARNNEVIANQNAVRAEQAGGVATENQGRKGAARLGALTASQAASGVNINSGSSVDVRAGERMTNQLDAETVMQNADLKAYGYRVQGQNFEAESRLDQAKADSAVPASILKAGGSLLSSASGIGGKWGGASSASSDTSAVDNYNSGNPIY